MVADASNQVYAGRVAENAPIEPMDRFNDQMDLMVRYGDIKNKVSFDPMRDCRFIPEDLK